MTDPAHRPGPLRRIAHEPLAQFIAIGLVIFALSWGLRGHSGSDAEPRIEVTPERIAALQQGFRQTWQRPPTAAETKELVETFIREEVHVREARALGLDRGDAVIRGRLMQLVVVIAEAPAETLTADDETLTAHLREHAERFTRPPRIAFEQVFLGNDPAPETVAKIRAALTAGTPPETLSFGLSLPARVDLAPAANIDRAFGPGFFEGLASVNPEGWQGPIPSAYGSHLVRIRELERARLPRLEDVRSEVERHWRHVIGRQLSEEAYQRMRARYEIILPDTPRPAL